MEVVMLALPGHRPAPPQALHPQGVAFQCLFMVLWRLCVETLLGQCVLGY